MTNLVHDIVDSDGNIDARALNTNDPGNCGTITRRDCYRLRAALARGAHLKEHTSATDYGSSGAHAHAVGECRHEGVAVPPLTYTMPGGGVGVWRVDR